MVSVWSRSFTHVYVGGTCMIYLVHILPGLDLYDLHMFGRVGFVWSTFCAQLFRNGQKRSRWSRSWSVRRVQRFTQRADRSWSAWRSSCRSTGCDVIIHHAHHNGERCTDRADRLSAYIYCAHVQAPAHKRTRTARSLPVALLRKHFHIIQILDVVEQNCPDHSVHRVFRSVKMIFTVIWSVRHTQWFITSTIYQV